MVVYLSGNLAQTMWQQYKLPHRMKNCPYENARPITVESTSRRIRLWLDIREAELLNPRKNHRQDHFKNRLQGDNSECYRKGEDKYKHQIALGIAFGNFSYDKTNQDCTTAIDDTIQAGVIALFEYLYSEIVN
ncbi:hypothetical protein ACNFJN_19195 [Xenorhabdus budapestensis]|uniref:hypothetical protein n=1 Tax=Xenorhabdus budapestensis TaxID=290110 RepID=UPI003A8A7FDC